MKQSTPNICIVNIFFYKLWGKKIEYYAAQVSILVCIRRSSSPAGYFQGEFSLFSLVFSGKCGWVKINHHSLLTCCFKITIHNSFAVEAKRIYVLATKKWYSEIAVFFLLFSCWILYLQLNIKFFLFLCQVKNYL